MPHFLRQIGQQCKQPGKIVFRCSANGDGVSIGLHRKQTDVFHHYSPISTRQSFNLKQRKTQMIHFGKRYGFHFFGHFRLETAAAAVDNLFFLKIKYHYLASVEKIQQQGYAQCWNSR